MVERRHSRNFNESEFSRFHRNFLGAVPRENRIKPAVDGWVYRIASLSATPRIRTNIFSKQLDWVELEEDGGREGRREWKEERVHCAQGKMVVALYREGIAAASYPSLPPRLVLFVSACRPPTPTGGYREREREREREGRGRRRIAGLSIFIMFARRKEKAIRQGQREEHRWDARDTKEFTVLYECVCVCVEGRGRDVGRRRSQGEGRREKRIFFTRTNVPIRLN